ncbi:MAG: hypothetical protein IT424_15870 [Pirellulales bacterium]|nr:hypothetical protein [Pirellulales bacterium]
MFAATVSPSAANFLNVSGWALIIALSLLLIIPYWRGKADLMTAWNFVLVGCIIFMGVACLEAADPPELVFERYTSFDFPDSYYRAMVARSIVFLACIFFFYYVAPLGRGFAAKRFVKMPPWSGVVFSYVIVLCAATAMLSLALQVVNIGFVKEAFANLGHKGATFAVAISFYAWYRNRSSPFTLVLFTVVLAAAALYAMRVSHGRRLLLCIAFAPIAVMYWTTWRFRRPTRVLLIGGAAVAAVITVGLWYQEFRFFDRGKHAQERNFANTIAAAKQVTLQGMIEQLESWKPRLAQGTMRYAAMTKRLVDSGAMEVHPFNTIQFILSYPIPRRYWPQKPESLGVTIVRDTLKFPQKTNWGLGVAGQAYYEGDWIALVIYAAMLVIIIRMLDEPLKREPNNPFFIAANASASLFIVTWIRGDLGVHTNEILECILFLWLLKTTCALVTGTKEKAYALDFGSAWAAARRRLAAH